jgi:DNA-directed RNA polymerase specialized sigma24 family protein
MQPPSRGSITHWVEELKDGDTAAAHRLWERYFNRLMQLARQKLRAARHAGRVEDEEDAALSAFDSLCRGAANGRFPRLNNRDDLWRLLVVITVRKAINQARRHERAKRGGGKLVGESALGMGGGNGLDHLIGNEPTPALAAMVIEQYCRLRSALRDDSLRQVLDLRLDGHSREEIAARLGCAEKTVTRKLNLIRETWEAKGE